MTTIIVGAGLSGLYAAMKLTEQGENVIVLEGRDRPGGRIRSDQVKPNGPAFDLGPTWFWPEHQTRLPELLRDLGVDTFEQFSDGEMVFEPLQGPVQPIPPQPMGPPSHRIVGGTAALIQALLEWLPDSCVRYRQTVTHLEKDARSIRVRTVQHMFVGERVLLAIPPRIAADRLKFVPALPDDAVHAMSMVPTWMAAHAKVVAVYDKPFWRDNGLSGQAFSYKGPMMEVHDASPVSGGPYALFGFVGVPAQQRFGRAAEIETMAVKQLGRLFGREAEHPLSVLCKDWAEDQLTAVAADQIPPPYHPTYAPLPVPDAWDGAIEFIGTEVAPQNGGYLEGCLEAVDAVC